MTEGDQIKRLAPVLFGVAGLMFFLAAWLSESIAFVGVGAMFIVLGMSTWLTARKKGSK